MLEKISKKNIIKLRKLIKNPEQNKEVILTEKQSILCIKGLCDACMFNSTNKSISETLKSKLYHTESIHCGVAQCIGTHYIYKLKE